MPDKPDKEDNADKKVKDLIDEASRAELEKWFGLPSFEQLAEQGKAAAPPEDPDLVAFRKRSAEALAAVDPALLEELRRRAEPPDDMMQFQLAIEPRFDPDFALFDASMIERQHLIAEPREREIPDRLIDDLRDATPQALLRDLHRPELWFTKTLELIDPLAEVRIDTAALVADALTSKKPEMLGSIFQEACALVAELRDERRRPWSEIKVPSRRRTP